MFLPSQLVEISQRFQPDVEDLEVLLQEEGLLVRSTECLQELSTRLGSDHRFRRDVAFLLCSMFGREADELGSMDVLGVLIVAAVGTRHEFDTPLQQQLMRELLRFVIQQRRPAAAPAVTPDVSEGEHRATKPSSIPPHLATGPQRSFSVPYVAAANCVGMPSVRLSEPEPLLRRVHTGWIAAVFVVLVIVGAGLLIRRGGSKPTTRERVVLAPAPSANSSAYPAASQGEQRAVLPRFQSSRNVRNSSPALRRAGGRHAEPPQVSAPLTATANTPQKTVEKTEAARDGLNLSQPISSNIGVPARPDRERAVVSPSADVARQRSTPTSADVSNVFAHPDAAAASARQVPPPVFRPKDPVLIARNAPAAAAVKPELQGTVHTGSTGTMASSLMYSPEPEYPSRAIAAGVQGQVTVRAVVGPRGDVIDASVVSGPPLLREAALDAVARWRYRPYQQDGKAVTIATTAILDFQLPPRR